jgi:GNAT superfamily N-acetyltransferase
MSTAENNPISQTAPLPVRRRRRWRYLLPRLDATIILRADVARLAGRAPAHPLAAYQVGVPEEVRGYLEALPAAERKSALRRVAEAERVVYLPADDHLAFWEFVQLHPAALPPEMRKRESGATAYIFGAFTDKRHRGHGLFTGGLKWLIDWLAGQGYAHLYSQTAVDDVISLLAHLAAGFEALGEGRHLHWGGRRYLQPTRWLPEPVSAGCQEQARLAGISARARESLRRALLCPR